MTIKIDTARYANQFRKLRADEIESRVQKIGKSKGGYYSMWLLYKDARCDMNVLDETVGAMNWQRHHTRDNANCIVSIYDEVNKQWVAKEDTGAESNTQAEKGLASDSFKRACFNWGIGRELYTAPTIFINLTEDEVKQNGTRFQLNTVSFFVSDVQYNKYGQISYLEMRDNKNKVRYNYGIKEKDVVVNPSVVDIPKEEVVKKQAEPKKAKENKEKPTIDEAKQLAKLLGDRVEKMLEFYKVEAITEMERQTVLDLIIREGGVISD